MQDELLDEVVTIPRKKYDRLKKKGDLVDLVMSAGEVLGSICFLGYTAFSIFVYGPIDTFKVGYSYFFHPEMKMRDFREAQALYAKRLEKDELNEKERLDLLRKLGVVRTDDYEPRPEDVKYSVLLDYIEKERRVPLVDKFGPEFE